MKPVNFVRNHRSLLVVFLWLSLIVSCNANNENAYFMALRSLDNGDEKTAIRLFKQGRSDSTELISRRSSEALVKLGNVTERHSAALYLAKNFSDNDALLIAVRELYRQNEYARILSLTSKLNFGECADELIQYRMKSLLQKNDSHFDQEFYYWMTEKPVSAFHETIYRKTAPVIAQKELDDLFSLNTNETPEESAIILSWQQKIIRYRMNVYYKKYKAAFEQTNEILRLFENQSLLPPEQILSDAGKAALYGTDDFKASAQWFDRLAKRLDSPLSYYAYFYSARLYEKAGRFQELTAQRYKQALNNCEKGEHYDNALWYLLNMLLRTSTDDVIKCLNSFFDNVTNASYFDDFFDSFSVLLLSHSKWQDFYDVWKIIDKRASEDTMCKFAYISGRLIEEDLASSREIPRTRETVNAFTRVLSSSGSLYYKVCALQRLNITDKTTVANYLTSGGKETDRIYDKGAEKLLAGYIEFGFPQKIYSEWLNLRNQVSVETSINASRFLGSCGNQSGIYSIQSLRIAGRTKESTSGKVPYELLELDFPRHYSKEISSACQENELSEPVVYALIRSESFFDATISSKAGASGLTQLMQGTADDEARKLKLGADYDIFDPETNIRMGTHYLKSLIDRSEKKSVLLALFSYNAGINNVRKWNKPSRLNMDLFLEMIPFPETREYGRKLVSAASLYGFLYYDITPAETVHNLMQF